MKKYVVILLVLCFGLFQIVSAEGEKSVSVGANLSIPSGDWSDFAGTGFGGTVQFLYAVNANMAVVGQAGYIMFGGKSIEMANYKTEWDYSAIPIVAGGRYYLGAGNGPKPFVGALVGLHMFKFKGKTTTTIFGTTQTNEGSESKTKFGFAPMAGVEVNNIDVSAFYMIISDLNYIGVRVAYAFPIGQ